MIPTPPQSQRMWTSANSPDRGRMDSRERRLRSCRHHLSDRGSRRKEARCANGRHPLPKPSDSKQEQALEVGVVHKGQDLDSGTGGRERPRAKLEQVRSLSASLRNEQPTTSPRCQMRVQALANNGTDPRVNKSCRDAHLQSSSGIRPIELLARTTIDSIQETLPWTLTLTRGERTHKFKNVVQETIRRNRHSCQSGECQTEASSRRTPISGKTSTCKDSEETDQSKLQRWETKDGQCRLEPPSPRFGRGQENKQQNHDEPARSGKKTITTYLKKDQRSKNLTWQTDLVIESSDDSMSADDDADLTDYENIFESATQQTAISATSSGGSKLKSEGGFATSEGIDAFGSDVKNHLIACATAAITANFFAAHKAGLRDAECGGHEWLPDGRDSYQPQEPAPPYHHRAGAHSVKSRTPHMSMDQTHSLHLSIDKIKTLVVRNLVATLVGVYILISLAVIMALILPYLFNVPRGMDAHDAAASDLISDAYKRAQKQIMDLESRPNAGSSPANQHEFEVQSNLKMDDDDYDKSTKRETNLVDTARHHDEHSRVSTQQLVAIQQSPPKQNEKRSDHVFDQKETLKNGAIDEEAVGVHYKWGDMWRAEHNGSCEPLQVPFCSRTLESMFTMDFNPPGQQNLSPNLPPGPKLYESTLLPNRVIRTSQSNIQSILEKYEPIVGVKCFALMRLFLCSNFAPKCIPIISATEPQSPIDHHITLGATSNLDGPSRDNNSALGSKGSHSPPVTFAGPIQVAKRKQQQQHRSRLVPPCRSLCKEAFRKCLFFFQVLSIVLIDPRDCNSLPESADPNVCIGKQELDWLEKATEHQSCPNDKFRCNSGECIPKKWRCDGFPDCPDKSDEIKCSRCNVATQFYCGQDVCIGKEQVCNGIRDCKDGRDERQCLRLSQIIDSQRGSSHNASRQLEVWSAANDLWMPVCGAHWSANQMSHEACQALGYSRANQTLYLFGPLTTLATNATKSVLSRLVSPDEQQSVTGKSERDLSNHQSRIGTWSSLGKKRTDESGSWAEIIEDMEGTVDKPASRRSHEIVYGRQIGMPMQDGLINYRVDKDLVAIDAGEVKFKSLTSMLFHGSLAGCMNKPLHMVSTVNLVCDNFQCGRSITSYSTRLRSAQHIRLETAVTTTTIKSNFKRFEGNRVWAGVRSGAMTQPSLGNMTNGENDTPNTARVQNFESYDEMDGEGDDEGDNHLDDENLFLMDGVEKQPDSPVSSRLVVGGIESMPGEFPYLAALHGGPDEIFFCGGVLISENWLLTAAHCVGNRSRPDGWMVKVGVTRRIASPSFVKKLKVKKIIKHYDFDHGLPFNNDIALILLEESVEFNQYLRPICLPSANLSLGPDNSKDCVVVGFGKSKFGQDANYLQVAHFANVPIVRRSVCSNWYQEQNVTLSEGMLCAGWAEGKRDACQGDSGSGLFCRYSSTNQFFVAGLVSFGIKCGTPKLPGVYTSVPMYVDWIESTTREHGYPVA